MEDSSLVRCDSLDAGSGCNREVIDHMTFDVEGSDPTANLEPSPAELAQCEAEVGTLLSIIAELNKKMGSLKPPSEPRDLRPPGPSRPLVPDLLSHRLVRRSPETQTASAAASKSPLTDRVGTGVVWTQLQEVLASVEDSISCRRTWAAPITSSDHEKHKEHLRAAQESWVKATQILEEMENEFGISCPSVLPKELYQGDILDLEKHGSPLRSILHSHQEELGRAQSTISQMEEERNKLISLHKAWRSGSRSPSYRPTTGSLSPDVGSPPFPGSPLLRRRTSRGLTPLSAAGDGSPLGSVTSGSPCPSPIGLETETERLNRYIERLKARNERLTAALERRKGESEQISVTLSRLESDCSALQTALKYCEECEEAYSELLSLYEAKKQQSIPLQTDPAEVTDRQQADSPSSELRNMGSDELSTSFSTAGVTEETETQSHTGQRTPELPNRETALRQQIEHLKRERAAISLPKPNQQQESKLSPETSHPAGSREGHVTRENFRPLDAKKEKASLFCELISVREEMSDLRSLIRLKEKELRCLEWSLMAQKAQEAAGVFVPESLREEQEDRKTEKQRFCEAAAKLGSDGDIVEARTRSILKELQAVLQREQALKKRLALVHDSSNTALSERRDSGEFARLTQAHSFELVPADSQKVSGASMEAGAESGSHDGQSAQPEWSFKSCSGGRGVEEGRDCSVILHLEIIQSNSLTQLYIVYILIYPAYSLY
ncbi:colorectal mutant cancer protein isoform X2 [Paralichthys olivaceus]|uniref:colorectal mutant cancer protein isoform X2 n=1 Tax=Paralichthys olivaceus TaxID=8255 RepID=UPI003752A625